MRQQIVEKLVPPMVLFGANVPATQAPERSRRSRHLVASRDALVAPASMGLSLSRSR